MSSILSELPAGSKAGPSRGRKGLGYRLLLGAFYWSALAAFFAFNGYWAWRRWTHDVSKSVPLASVEKQYRIEIEANDRLRRQGRSKQIHDSMAKSKAIQTLKPLVAASPNDGAAARS